MSKVNLANGGADAPRKRARRRRTPAPIDIKWDRERMQGLHNALYRASHYSALSAAQRQLIEDYRVLLAAMLEATKQKGDEA